MATATKAKTRRVTVAVLAFPYRIEVDHPYQSGELLINDRVGNRGDEIDVLEYDFRRGERLNAFLKEGQAVEDIGNNKSSFSAVDATDTELLNWIKDDNPTVQDVIDASEGDAETALRLLGAENAATGNDPRRAVVAGLETVVRNSAE